MSHTQGERHPFLDNLTADAELISSPLRGPVIGRDEIRLAVNAVGSFYASQTPTFLQRVGSRLFLGIRGPSHKRGEPERGRRRPPQSGRIGSACQRADEPAGRRALSCRASAGGSVEAVAGRPFSLNRLPGGKVRPPLGQGWLSME